MILELAVFSTAFAMGMTIPEEYTCEGDDSSPAISWSGAPEETQSYAIICDDPDAPSGEWVHWVYYNIPADTESLFEDVADVSEPAQGGMQGENDFGNVGYGGPCPPPGYPHRYYFKVYALDAVLDYIPRLTKDELLNAMDGHILAEGELEGRFGR